MENEAKTEIILKIFDISVVVRLKNLVSLLCSAGLLLVDILSPILIHSFSSLFSKLSEYSTIYL